MHGKADNLIPYKHAEELSKKCKVFCQLHLVEGMDHNQFEFETDLILPYKHFIR